MKVRTGWGAWAVTGALVAALVVPAAAAGLPPGADENPLQTAGRAAEEVAFVGVLEVRWVEGGSDHAETLLVQGGNGSVVVKGGTNVMASAQQRLVEHAGRWELLSPAGPASASRPPPSLKYQLSSSAGPVISNRTTHAVEVRHGGSVVERLYLDGETGLLLRREQFDGSAVPTRTIQFQTISIGMAASVPDVPDVTDGVRDVSPTPVSERHLADGVSAPSRLAGDYRRVGIYEHGGVTQVRYSDGLYDVSVFQQPGRIERGLPAGSTIAVGDQTGRRYSWTGNHILLWEAKGMVYTAVSDAPLGQVVAALGSLPLERASPAVVRRLRQAARALVQPRAA